MAAVRIFVGKPRESTCRSPDFLRNNGLMTFDERSSRSAFAGIVIPEIAAADCLSGRQHPVTVSDLGDLAGTAA
jgi:hypothetical protein